MEAAGEAQHATKGKGICQEMLSRQMPYFMCARI